MYPFARLNRCNIQICSIEKLYKRFETFWDCIFIFNQNSHISSKMIYLRWENLVEEKERKREKEKEEERIYLRIHFRLHRNVSYRLPLGLCLPSSWQRSSTFRGFLGKILDYLDRSERDNIILLVVSDRCLPQYVYKRNTRWILYVQVNYCYADFGIL